VFPSQPAPGNSGRRRQFLPAARVQSRYVDQARERLAADRARECAAAASAAACV